MPNGSVSVGRLVGISNPTSTEAISVSDWFASMSRITTNPCHMVERRQSPPMRIFPIVRKSEILASASLACLRDVVTVNLTTGCAHGCVYCYTRGYSAFPGENCVGLYQDLPRRLREELQRKRKLPKRVWFSSSCDLFQPVPKIQNTALEVLQILFQAGIEVAFLTKGTIPEAHFQLFERFAPLCHAQIGLITTDDAVRQVFEPNAAPVSVRLAQAARLHQCGIPVSFRLDPILPEFTDTPADFEALCTCAVQAGARDIAASVLFLRPGFASTLRRHFQKTALPPLWHERLERMLARYQGSSKLSIRTGTSTTQPLPLSERLGVFRCLAQATHRHALRLHICTCKNPDLPPDFFGTSILPSCQIVGEKPEQSQLPLFDA